VSPLLRGSILWATEQPIVRSLITRTPIFRQIAGRFVAGDDLEAGVAAVRELDGQGIAAMLDHLGEKVGSPAQAASAADDYIQALKRVRESPEFDANISVKLTQLGLDSGTDVALENMERLLQVAGETDPPTLVMIDMEARQYVDGTLDGYLQLRERHPNVGVCLQSYLHRTAADAQRIGGPSAIVRMTKGAYLEPPEVAYSSKRDVTRNFARIAATLLGSGATVHLATHDAKLVEGARRFIRERGIPRERYEFQMLYGIRRDIQQDLVRQDEPVRVYVPYGTQWYPYLTRRLAERPANVWFFLSNLLRRGG
jgi:proline dehydrogenase